MCARRLGGLLLAALLMAPLARSALACGFPSDAARAALLGPVH